MQIYHSEVQQFALEKNLGGGFKYFLEFSHLFGEDFQFA